MENGALVARLEAVDRRRVAMLEMLASLDEAALTARPAPGKWSIAEIVEHLVLSERGALRVIEEGAGPTRRRRLKHRVVYWIVRFVLRADIPVKALSRSLVPTGKRPLGELREEWDRNHERIRAYAGSLDGVGARRAVFSHPIAGPMTPAQAVAVVDSHMQRHFRQIRRILDRRPGSRRSARSAEDQPHPRDLIPSSTTRPID